MPYKFIALSVTILLTSWTGGLWAKSSCDAPLKADQRSRVAERLGLDPANDDSGFVIRRVRRGTGFAYLDEDGKRITSERIVRRFRDLNIGPTLKDVRINRNDSAHLQAYGFDRANRRQYVYHPLWESVRAQVIFGRLSAFATALPELRQTIAKDLKENPASSKEAVRAAVIKLVDLTFIRIGAREPEEQDKNPAFGLTTMPKDRQHLRVSGKQIRFSFNAKSDQPQIVTIEDQTLADFIRKIRVFPCESLFCYRQKNGYQRLTANDVNEYIQEITGQDFTAKDFRTWGATVAAAEYLAQVEVTNDEDELQEIQQEAAEHAAAFLGNEASTCLNSYIDPRIFTAFAKGDLARAFRATRERTGLSQAESAVLTLLQP